MRRSSLSLAFVFFLAACSRPAPQSQTQAPAPPAGVQWAVMVLYNNPKDTAAFEKYYAETHVPLFASHAKEIGVTRVELVKYTATADGKAPTLYRLADLRWESKEAMEKGLATPGFKAVAADLPNFATGGVTVLIGMKTN
ncbi:MAG TPA: EthD family reductase [Gemmatimonadales bacterium]|nr:EthD family reductase [Gemmatimonadales bacterium]